MVRHHRQRRQQRQRIKIDDVAALACQRAAWHVALADAEAVGEEDQIAFPAFGRLGGMDVMVEPDTGIGGDVGMPPGGEVIAVAAQGHADPHFFWLIQVLLWARCRVEAWQIYGMMYRRYLQAVASPLPLPA